MDGPPSRLTAVIIRTRLPAPLERLRRVASASDPGLPAHVTMLHPFMTPERMSPTVRGRLAAVAERHEPFAYRLLGRGRWPDTEYVVIEPERPFTALQADFARAFRDFPIYGAADGFVWTPHVTVDGDAAFRQPSRTVDPAWETLPQGRRAEAVEVIVRGASDRWRIRWRIGLGRRARR